jgi:hypothetical protein
MQHNEILSFTLVMLLNILLNNIMQCVYNSLLITLIALMMAAVRTSETMVNLNQSTWCYNPETPTYILTTVRTSNSTVYKFSFLHLLILPAPYINYNFLFIWFKKLHIINKSLQFPQLLMNSLCIINKHSGFTSFNRQAESPLTLQCSYGS